MRARDLIKQALLEVGVQDPQEPVPAAREAVCFTRLNQMIQNWHTQDLTSLVVTREVFSVVANTSTYSIGPGGDFDTVRPIALEGAGLLLNTSSPPIEIPRGILTDDSYEAIQVKTLTNLLWTDVYYNPTNPLGSIFLWPTPTTADNDCVLYLQQFLTEFANETTDYTFAPGYEEALLYNLAIRLTTQFGVQPQSMTVLMAKETLADLKRVNVKLTDLPTDPAITHDRRGGYNIQTGLGG